MTLTTSAWDRPIQGVSQQPPKIRLPGQCSVQENAISSVVSGLVKRPGTVRVGELTNKMPEGTAYYYYNRGTGEEYFIALAPSSLPRVFDIEGDELVVENQLSNNSYIFDGNPRETFRFSTISDYTFIVNRNVVPRAASTTTPALSPSAIINVQFADYGRKYTVTVDGTEVVTYLTPDGSDAGHIVWVSTDTVAEILMLGDSYATATGATLPPSATIVGPGLANHTGYTATRAGNTIILNEDTYADFSVTTVDGADGRDLFVIKNSAKSVSDLPLYAPDGYKVKIVGEGNSNDDDYWLVAESSSGDTVTWREAVAPEVSTGFNPDSMPVVLIRDRFELGKAVFSLEYAPWDNREVGDNDSNPLPSFIQDGVPITSVGTFQNRLRLTAGESAIYSRSNRFFSFFRSTVRAALDDEPIDVYADTNKVNVLQNSVVLDGDAVFFSPNGQFLQRGGKPITKSNATLEYASTFENTADCEPVAGGDVIFFAFEYGEFSGIREFYTDSLTDTKRARPVTDHVNEYIPGTATLLATSTNRNQLLVLAESRNEVFVYNWLWQGQERVQSSWSKWVFDGVVRHIAYESETIYFLIERNGSLELEYIETGDPDDRGITFSSRLDRKFYATATKTGNQWEITLPYSPKEPLLLVRGEGCLDAGVTISYEIQGNVAVTSENLAEDGVTEVEVIGGERFRLVYEPTMPFVRDHNGRVIDTDRLIINDVHINYDKTGSTDVIVENSWGVVRNYEFNGRRVGGFNNLVGFAPILPGQFTFPIRQESDRVTFRIETDSHIPFQLRDMEWRGRFTQRGRRV